MSTPIASQWFNEYGHFTGALPEECWRDCSTPGQPADESVAFWRRRLNFTVPRKQAIDWLADFGSWPRFSDDYDTGLNDMSDEDLAEKVLWLASCDMRENGEWFGLCH